MGVLPSTAGDVALEVHRKTATLPATAFGKHWTVIGQDGKPPARSKGGSKSITDTETVALGHRVVTVFRMLNV